jgi:hypothetical protein
MEETEIFKKFVVPLEAYTKPEELEKAVTDAISAELEMDFVTDTEEHFWVRFEFPNLHARSLYGDLEVTLVKIFQRYLSNLPSAWQVNSSNENWHGGSAWVDVWMGPADLLSIIH